MDSTQADGTQAPLRAGVYGRLSETYDAAESVPTQLDRGTDHAGRRGWAVVATFNDTPPYYWLRGPRGRDPCVGAGLAAYRGSR